MITNSASYSSFASFDSLLDKYSKQYENISLFTIEDTLFILRPLTRKEFKKINDDLVYNVTEKKDMICNLCILYPPNFDLENCVAGIPEQIYEEILKISYIKDEDMLFLLDSYMNEMNYVHTQMECTIAMAFPAYKLEEIENMTMIQFCKIYSRAEWILNNKDTYVMNMKDYIEASLSKLNAEDYDDTDDDLEEDFIDNDTDIYNTNTEYENKDIDINTNTNKKNRPIDKMTEEQKQAMEEFYRKYPQFNKSTDYVYSGEVIPEYKEAPAFRPNYGRRR